LLLALAGLAAVFGAFLPFYTYANGIDVTVWSRGLFPTAALIPLLGVAVGIEALFVLVRGHEPRSPFLNFTWEQVRLAAGSFMILLSLSYLLQDRAGGALGIGYALLGVSSLATFAGGVLTRRAQLARAGEEAAEREPRPVLGPAIASVSRASSNIAKNVADRSHTMRVRLAERREARTAARKEAAEKAQVERAAAEKVAAERAAAAQAAAAKTAAAERAAAQNAAAEQAEAERAAAEKPAAEPAAEATAAAEPVGEDETAQPPPPATTVEALPTSAQPPAATMDQLPLDEPVREPVQQPEPVEQTEPLEERGPTATDQPEDTSELPVADGPPHGDDKKVEEPRATKLSTVPAELEADATRPDGEQARDGQDATVERAAEPGDTATEEEKEGAESSSESSSAPGPS
jgi:hypothetical protein